MRYLLADPELTTRSGGEEFARVVAASAPGEDVVVRLRASLATTFPLAQTRPRYTVRHLLKVAVPATEHSYRRSVYAHRPGGAPAAALRPDDANPPRLRPGRLARGVPPR
jgi:hypothetical protein